MFKLLVSAGTAIALATAPAVATAQSQPAPDTRSSQVDPASEEVEGSQVRGGFILPLLGIIAAIVAIYLLTKKDKDEVVPISP
jgi:phosphotransferase system  glucose/maltose/N-acetylglucosamine-specific IIC component